MNYAKLTAVMATSITLQKYLEDQKILSTPSEIQKKSKYYTLWLALLLWLEELA